MWNDLDRPTKIVAATFLRDDLRVDLPRCKVADAAQADVNEAFVVTQIEVRFCAVIEHVHLAMLIRRHRARVHVNVWVQFLNRHFESTLFEEQTGCRCRHALPNGRNHATGKK